MTINFEVAFEFVLQLGIHKSLRSDFHVERKANKGTCLLARSVGFLAMSPLHCFIIVF